jgi:hypothetical protein
MKIPNDTDVTKHFYKSTQDCTIFSIRTNYYASDLEYFLNLFEIAKKDFPELKEEDVKFVHYGGQRIKGIFGLEFSRQGYKGKKKEYKAKGYEEREHVEPIL